MPRRSHSPPACPCARDRDQLAIAQRPRAPAPRASPRTLLRRQFMDAQRGHSPCHLAECPREGECVFLPFFGDFSLRSPRRPWSPCSRGRPERPMEPGARSQEPGAKCQVPSAKCQVPSAKCQVPRRHQWKVWEAGKCCSATTGRRSSPRGPQCLDGPSPRRSAADTMVGQGAPRTRMRGATASSVDLVTPPISLVMKDRGSSRWADAILFYCYGRRAGRLDKCHWPLARLSATPEQLAISVLFAGTYRFAPGQVVAIERYVLIPVLGWGVKIVHCRTDCPGISFSGVSAVRKAFCKESARQVSCRPLRSRASRSVAAFRCVGRQWSGSSLSGTRLFLLDLHSRRRFEGLPGSSALLALLFVFALSLGMLKSPRVQRLVLNPGRDIGEIRTAVKLVAFISGFMLAIFSIIFACGGFKPPGRKQGQIFFERKPRMNANG